MIPRVPFGICSCSNPQSTVLGALRIVLPICSAQQRSHRKPDTAHPVRASSTLHPSTILLHGHLLCAAGPDGVFQAAAASAGGRWGTLRERMKPVRSRAFELPRTRFQCTLPAACEVRQTKTSTMDLSRFMHMVETTKGRDKLTCAQCSTFHGAACGGTTRLDCNIHPRCERQLLSMNILDQRKPARVLDLDLYKMRSRVCCLHLSE